MATTIAAPTAPTAPITPDAPDAPDRRAVIAWVLYDLANVVFVMNIASLYFPLWVVDDAGGSDGHYGIASSLSMAVVFVAAPFLGALSDLAPRRIPFLAVTTATCCALTLLLGHGGLIAALVCFALANAVFQSGLIFYDALLPVVSTEANRGWVSGLGIGAGFGGALIGIATGLVVLSIDPSAKPLVFKLTAVIFLLGSLPCFLWVRERPRPNPARLDRAAMRQALADLRDTAKRSSQYPGLRRFLIGRVFYTDAANTLLVFMGVYAAKEIGFSDLQTQLVLLAGILAGPFGALGCGRAVDRVGPKRTLNGLLVLWALVLTLVAAIPLLALPTGLFWLVAPLAGIALGGTGTTDRTLLLRLSPPQHIGQFYGLFAMVGRFAAITGPLLWTLIVEVLDRGRPAAVASLVALVILSRVILHQVDDRPRIWVTGPTGTSAGG